ncbi:MAG TPA: hypothetical protein VJQ56_11760 [Blastocatellia bacterium]|nr:hypothetical protein [Blastocatellia bacterium]
MINRIDLKKEVGSLDMLINVLADELSREPLTVADDESGRLLEEMKEALDQLRQARGLRKMWVVALEGQNAFESGKTVRRRSRISVAH